MDLLQDGKYEAPLCTVVVLPVTTVCSWVYHTWRWMKSEQRSVPTAEAASLPGFNTNRDCDSSWQPPAVFDLCARATFWSHSPNQCSFCNTNWQTQPRTWKIRFSHLQKYLQYFLFYIPWFHQLHICKYVLQSFRCTCKALFLFLLLLSFECVHARTSLNRSERVGGHLIPQFPWIDF